VYREKCGFNSLVKWNLVFYDLIHSADVSNNCRLYSICKVRWIVEADGCLRRCPVAKRHADGCTLSDHS
jgi:hypothetical protein